MSANSTSGSRDWSELRNDLSERIDDISKLENRPIFQAQEGIRISQKALAELRESTHETPFPGVLEQIHYYKEIEPFFLARVIFFSRLQWLETGRPAGDRNTQENYLQKEWQYIRDFHAEQRFLYRYIRAGETWLDEKLFGPTRDQNATLPDIDAEDPFLYNASRTVARLHACDLMQDYLLRVEEELAQPRDGKQRNIGKLIWTDSKTALIELAYAVQSAGSFNDHKADLREIIECFQSAFHIDLGHYPRVFQEILSRKTGYTNYIDRLRDKLLLRIKIIEEKYDPK